MNEPTPSLLRADAVFHNGSGSEELRGVSLAIEGRRFTLLSGGAESGAGMLLRVLALLARPDAGEVWIEGQATRALDDGARLALRNHVFGFVFAEPFLLDSFSVAENVAMPLFKINGVDIEQARDRTAQVLDFAGLAAAADTCVAELSVLDQHKVALARALAISPRVLIAQDAGMQLKARDMREFTMLLRTAPGLLGVAVIATSPAELEMLGPDREIRLEEGRIVADSHPVTIGV
jgi:lipoprotein-releasing system ATP-binding protein